MSMRENGLQSQMRKLLLRKDPDELVKEVQKKYKISDIFLTHIPEKGVALVYACLSVS